MQDNVYLPQLARVVRIADEVAGERAIKTYHVEPLDSAGFEHACGQCAMLSIFGRGEMMISIASSPLVKEYKQFTIMRTGRVSLAFHELAVGDVVGMRGPYGNSFPIEAWRGKNLVFIGGGVGLAPIWPLITTAMAQRGDFGDIGVFYSTRSSSIMYRAELEALRGQADVHLEGWRTHQAGVAAGTAEQTVTAENSVAVVCGPPAMIKSVIQNLCQLGFADEQIFTTLENKMKCGVGKCGRCNVGKDYVCVKGPVYSWAELKKLPQEY
ncbi:hydrogenase [Sulfurimicrobium lacus]|uniref:Hydrogenase n=1 Tax=Sulfurimicrobium lacus TaxID=2715678 RepID=A0A6F8V9U2_9PROT|nr:FAD/NAD(P)-binding protein [Sulfurimicrobium lacus]BCB25742.1 hydrogenase [Sulfurimicrobium lacus]